MDMELSWRGGAYNSTFTRVFTSLTLPEIANHSRMPSPASHELWMGKTSCIGLTSIHLSLTSHYLAILAQHTKRPCLISGLLGKDSCAKIPIRSLK